MNENDYSWLSSAADELGMWDFAQQVRDSKPHFNEEKLINIEILQNSKQRRFNEIVN